MIVTVYTRHNAACKKKYNHPTSYRRCKCPKWLYCAEWIRPQRSAHTRSWEEAELRARKLEHGEAVLKSPHRTVEQAVESYLSDASDRNLSTSYCTKVSRELRELTAWAKVKPVVELKSFNVDLLSEFRSTWKTAAVTRKKRQERLCSFFKFCNDRGWIADNPAKKLSAIKTKTKPTVPFSREQFEAVMRAVETYHAPNEHQRDRARTMLLLLRWSGLRLGDASRLERGRLVDGKILLYMAKTGNPVYVPLPPKVATMLEQLSNPANPRYFFWSGNTNVNTPVFRWWETLKAIFKKADVPYAHPHMLRDTFAVELLLAGVPLDQVSILLGHSSVKITEKHYSPWVKSRQEQLEQSVQKAWD